MRKPFKIIIMWFIEYSWHDLISRDDLFKMLPFMDYPSTLLTIIRSLHDRMISIVHYDEFMIGSWSKVKQGCVLALILVDIFFANERLYFPSRSDGWLFNIGRLKAKIRKGTIKTCCLLMTQPSHQTVQKACETLWTCVLDLFDLVISLKNTEVMGQDTPVQRYGTGRDTPVSVSWPHYCTQPFTWCKTSALLLN